MANFLTKLFGSHSSHELKKINPIADRVDALEEQYKKLSDAELRAKTDEFRTRYQNGETLDQLLPEAFATCREAAWRVLGMRHYRVQVIGGIVLHQGRIAEMKTGEGKTLVATLPAYLNAIAGKGVHIVTVNDYLAKRDSEWMGKVYRFLGLTVGLVIHEVEPARRKAMYEADITYGTNNEFGFDYLRDNMAIYKQSMVQRGHAFAIVDEVDSILIDEARTPLIISGQGEQSSALYQLADRFAAGLKQLRVKEVDAKEEQDDIDADYIVDEKARTATLTPHGQAKAEAYFQVANLSDPENTTLQHHINQAIKARGVMQRDVDYVVRDGQIIIVDEFTGRLMFGRRYNEGLHQAIEAKEGVKVQHESKTLATITFQNYFRLYGKLSGMTGTALTEEEEFRHIYKLDVIEIPTNKPVARKDNPDAVYKNERGKIKATIARIEECHAKGQPILVGTVSIEKSEELSKILKAKGIRHTVLNAKYHEREADIVAQAGKPGAVTIATNMAGRGTDIMLGGNAETMALDELKKGDYTPELLYEANGHAETDDPEVLAIRAKFEELYRKYKQETDADAEKVRAAGGLYILGTERHESRRIDNQLRGRAGRQGDPGESSFYISLEDDLMRLFGSEKIQNMMDSLGIEEDEPIDQKILSGAIENAQKKIESRNFATRKHVLEYDDVLNTQRQTIYSQRLQVLEGKDVKDSIVKMIDDTIARAVHAAVGEHTVIEPAMVEQARRPFLGVFLRPEDCTFTPEECDDLTADQLTNVLADQAHRVYEAKEQALTPPIMRELERVVLLKNVDTKWMDHIDAMTELRNGIGLRAYGQHDPVVEYKREGFDMFDAMIDAIREDTVRMIFLAQVRTREEPKREQVAKETSAAGASDGTAKPEPKRVGKKIGPNDPCPCGSGKKYKKCCYLKADNPYK
ncbi:preprotein translocase subunit SecA [Agathobaculum sp. NSJ-28]|uniref:Protein translocase subunit SecA n=2 Tax=Agathobaculum TaxID=2048137 RepID=A0A923RXH8_9FIRM|nr:MULTISPECIES: preprotein translocase subunit SecA [Butyricicoccaceae]MBS6881781.1 preprotein translocase subunit SecA [Clostridiaceae bacterium]SCI60622.1 preprotein translocase subunit SecA [uncultured Butyricicoccus sp.]MBC5724395.1 preprotein translocase subunit SecA [Agathobaculum faecis]MCU6788134.1 preprotein translocase subunit SecA [Agathobaculum ammoniilyticum]WOC75313.1 preprotein translocase subunit SecA [Intestinibacillus sp. NTUH-41-i26]